MTRSPELRAVDRVAWDDDPVVAAWPGLPPLQDDVTADACVIGLGGSGLAAVEELVGRGLSVVGLDAGRVAAGAAGRNGGFLLGGPEAPLHTAIEVLGEDAAVWLYRETLHELDHLAQLLPGAVQRTGSLRLAGLPGAAESAEEEADRAREAADIDRQAAALRACGIAVDTYDGPLGSGVYLPDDASVNPARRAVGLAAVLRPRARLHERSVVRSITPGCVSTDVGSVSCSLIIVAVDGRLEVLVPQLAGRVRTARLQMLATAPVPPGRLPCPVYGRWGYDYAQQAADGRIFVGGGRDLFAEDEWTLDAVPTPAVQSYIERLAARMAGASVAVDARWAASAGFSLAADLRPVCAEVAPRVMACGGYSGTGNLVGPVAVRAAVAHLMDGTPIPRCFGA